MTQVERAAQIIQVIEYLTIASVCPDGQPWNTPVYTAYDDVLNFYWASWVDNQHSQNIMVNRNVFLVLYDSRARAGEGEGVYMQAHAHALMEEDAKDIELACRLLKERESREAGDFKKYLHGAPRRIFKAIPHKAWTNDGSTKDGDFIDVRRSLDLEVLRRTVNEQT